MKIIAHRNITDTICTHVEAVSIDGTKGTLLPLNPIGI
jgi:hypothetical protein